MLLIKEGGRVTTIGPPDDRRDNMNDYKLSEKLLKLIERKRLSIN
jgi:hypothetical protein